MLKTPKSVNHKKKILFYTPMSLRYGGGFEEWLRKTTYLLSSNYVIRIIYGDIGYPYKLDLKAILSYYSNKATLIPVHYIRLPGPIYIISPRSYMVLIRECKNSDIVYFNSAFFLQELWLLMARAMSRTRVIVGFHSSLMFNRGHDILFMNFSRHLLRRFDEFHTLNQQDKSMLESLGFQHVHTIHNYLLDTEIPAVKNRPPTDCTKFVIVGRYEKMKGIDVIISTIEAYLVNNLSNPLSTFHFYGAGTHKECIANLINNYPTRVFDHGYQTDKRIVYADKNFILLPSKAESFSLVLIEAMSYGIPAIATPTNGAKEIIKSHKTGFVLKDYSVNSFLEVILNIESLSQQTHENMSRDCYDEVRRQYSERYFYKKIVKIMEGD